MQRRQNGGRTIAMVALGLPWSPDGGTVVATVIAQWTLLVGQRRHSGGSREAALSLKLVYNVYNSTHCFTGRPMADPCASILRPRRCVCLPPASFERSVSDRPPRRPLCDCFEHAQNFRATMASMVRSERPLCHPWTTKTTSLPPLCLQRRPGEFNGRTGEPERSPPLCKGGISVWKAHRKISWNLETTRLWSQTFPIDLKFHRQLGSSAAEMPVKFQSNANVITPNLAVSKFLRVLG